VTSNTTIRHAEATDLPALFEAFRTNYKNHDNLRQKDYFDWQFLYAPAWDQKHYSFLIAESSQGLAGWLGYIPVKVVVDGAVKNASVTALWASLNRDLTGLQLLEALKARADLTMLLGCSRESYALVSLARMKVLPEIPRLIAIIDPSGCKDLFGDTAKFLEVSQTRLPNEFAGAGFIEIDRFPAGFVTQIAETQNVKAMVVRDANYLNWRYKNIPRHNYRILLAGENNYVVFRIEQVMGFQHWVMRIVELNVKPEFISLAVGSLIAICRENKAIMMDFFSTNAALNRNLSRAGFRYGDEYKSVIPRYFRPMFFGDDEVRCGIFFSESVLSGPIDYPEWYVTSGDADNDRVKK
jgi:hypothetical protein